MKNQHRNRRGFSLIELLIAAVIAAAAGALLIGGLVAANRSAEIRMAQTLSTHVLANQLALLDNQLGPKTPITGTVSSPLGQYTWTLAWTEAPLAPLAETTLTVTSPQGASHVVTYRQLAQQ